MSALPTELVNRYLIYNFLIKWDQRYVAAVTRAGGLTRRTQVVSLHPGGQPQRASKIPGQTDYEPVRLERGITTDKAFEDWGEHALDLSQHAEARQRDALATVRKPMQIELYDQAGIIRLRYNLYNCRPSEYAALPELESEADTVA
jgi:phage tail-like protein